MRTRNKLFSWIPGLLILFLLSPVFNAQAVQVEELYQAAVPVENQNPSGRTAALRKILEKVLIKVSGESVISGIGSVPFTAIEQMVEQFGYDSIQSTPTARPQLHLWARLNPQSVKRLVRELQLPIWPEERPETLVWLVVEDKQQRIVLAEGSAHQVSEQLTRTAGQRGLPVILPLMDLEESAQINFDSIAAMQASVLTEVSEKYASQYVLVGYIQKIDQTRWRGRWTIIGQGEVQTTAPGPLSDVIAAGINPLATQIAARFSSYSLADSEQYIDLIIDDIHGTGSYARALSYLDSLSLVSRVDVTAIQNGNIHFRLHTRADLASIMQVIGLGNVLYPREDVIDQLVFGLNP